MIMTLTLLHRNWGLEDVSKNIFISLVGINKLKNIGKSGKEEMTKVVIRLKVFRQKKRTRIVGKQF